MMKHVKVQQQPEQEQHLLWILFVVTMVLTASNSINGDTSNLVSNVLYRLRNHHGIIARSPQKYDTVIYFTVSPLSSKEQSNTILAALHETVDWINTATTATFTWPVV
jgi:hypothetical protein